MDILEKVVSICNRKDCTDCIHEREDDRYPRVLNYCIWCNNGSEYQADYEKVELKAIEENKAEEDEDDWKSYSEDEE